MRNPIHHIISGALAGLLLLLPVTVMAAPVNDTFDHFTTGFSLTGGHRAVECDACHTAGQFRGTPRECASCHNLLMNTGAVVKSSAHIQTSNDCQTCHSTLAWDDVRRVNHMAVLGDCRSCHNNTGGGAGGPPNTGIHTGAIAGTSDCIACHRTSTWASVHFNHAANIGNKACSDCHNGIDATGTPGNSHATYPSDCTICHNTHSWRFNHGTTTKPCSDCHNNVIVTGKPGNHFSTLLECNYCHSTRAWLPASFNHPNPSFPPDHGWSSSCDRCHSGAPQSSANVNVYDYSNTSERACIVCHYGDFRKEHSDSEIASKKNCLVNCHEHSMRKW